MTADPGLLSVALQNELPNDPIGSPCVRRCALDPMTDVCSGCLRSFQEIVGWTLMTTQQRRAVMEDLPRREEERRRAPPPEPAYVPDSEWECDGEI